MVYIVGIGPGHRDYILPKALDTLEKSDIILGFYRAIESLNFIAVPKVKVHSLREIIEFVIKNPKKTISIAASGDPNFYGISSYIKNNYEGEINIIPGLSSFQYLCTKLNKPWQNAYLGSLHGREADFIKMVKGNKLSIWLTDSNNFPGNICNRLLENSMHPKVYIGENLSYEEEKIYEGYPEDFVNKDFNELNVVLIENNIDILEE